MTAALRRFFCAAALLAVVATACTDFLVSGGASADGSTMFSYAADSQVLYGCLYHRPAATYAPGALMDVYEWDTGHYLGKIPQAQQTYTVIGNVNEYGVGIGESTWGGLDQLQHQSRAVVDYGTMIYVALQRSRTAREAIAVMTSLAEQFGYYSEGESFSIGDPNEVWVLELIGKGEYEMGAVWVAVRLEEGHVTGHANQARITTFPRNDSTRCLYSRDVLSFARARGLYPAWKADEDFSFSDTYNPVSPQKARSCEARVWSFFRKVSATPQFWDSWTDYVTGWNVSHRMPWSVPVNRKLGPYDIMMASRDHFEGTVLDFRGDIGAGAWDMPFRWRPLTWNLDGKTYVNERSTGTQQTGFIFVAQMRKNVPRQIAAINWFGVDDASLAVYTPIYTSITAVPPAYAAKGNGDIMSVSLDSAFWIFSLVNNLAYTRWNTIAPEVLAEVDTLQKKLIAMTPSVDSQATFLLNQGRNDEAVALLTKFSVDTAQSVFTQWKDLWMKLVARFIDGNVKNVHPGEMNPDVQWPGYGERYYRRVVAETGSHYLLPTAKVSSPKEAAVKGV